MRYPAFARDFFRLYFGFALVAAVALAACEENNYPSAPDDGEPDTITIFTTARVIAGTGSIAFEDTSTTIPADRISTVFVQVRDSTGKTADSTNVAPHGEVTFTGLAPGEYTVEQTVTLDTQRRGPTNVHGPFTVS